MSRIAQIKNELKCLGSTKLDVIDLEAVKIYSKIEKLQAKCPDTVFNGGEEGYSLEYIKGQLDCGAKMSLAELNKIDAAIEVLLSACEAEKCSIFATGIATAAADSASLTFAIPGVLATDVVVATVHTAAAAEYVLSASTDADEINVTLSAAADSGVTKINYTVTRCP